VVHSEVKVPAYEYEELILVSKSSDNGDGESINYGSESVDAAEEISITWPCSENQRHSIPGLEPRSDCGSDCSDCESDCESNCGSNCYI
jgi:hypothetical protein